MVMYMGQRIWLMTFGEYTAKLFTTEMDTFKYFLWYLGVTLE